ncbi:MAG: Valine--tRNA ligase [bacterium ADurb.BinA186]|nr:MAG: Valine--tRNA ligase [bacterium ADurb.BinA186]
MAKTSSIEVFERGEPMPTELSVINSSAHVDAVIMLAGLIDVEKESLRLKNALDKIVQQIQSLEARLAHESFVKNAPSAVVATHRNELAALKDKQEQLSLGLKRLQS